MSGQGSRLRHVLTTTAEHAAQHATHIDVDFPTRPGTAASAGARGAGKPPAPAYIRFRNYYAHSLTVRQLMTPLDGPPEAARWSTLLADYALMRSSHHEDDAQAWHVLCVRDDFRRGAFYPGTLTRLRFEVKQPSAMWKMFSLRHIEFFEIVGEDGGGDVREPGEHGGGELHKRGEDGVGEDGGGGELGMMVEGEERSISWCRGVVARMELRSWTSRSMSLLAALGDVADTPERGLP